MSFYNTQYFYIQTPKQYVIYKLTACAITRSVNKNFHKPFSRIFAFTIKIYLIETELMCVLNGTILLKVHARIGRMSSL